MHNSEISLLHRAASTFIEITKDKADEAEAHRIAGEIALKSPKHDIAKAEAYFQSALAIARQQQAKSLNYAPQ